MSSASQPDPARSSDNLAARNGRIWPSVHFADARAGIRFLLDVFGFQAQLVVPMDDDAEAVQHSQLRWPEGGLIMASSAGRRGDHRGTRPTGVSSIYVVTADPMAVHVRCVAAKAVIVSAPEAPHYDPDGVMFTVRDPEGNHWSFGTYRGEPG